MGEETGHEVWENKTLDQCTELCNNIEGCEGFSRDLKLDTEKANCYPNNAINKCYSNRKGDTTQMQNAIKFNSFIKSNVPNVLTLCIGDKDLTLNRNIFIKSHSMPKSCLGVSDDSRVTLIDNTKENFKQSCNFKIKSGMDGVGTVSFMHIDTGKYLYRNFKDNLILYDISSGQTENNQRASFNLYDSPISSGSIMFKSMQIEGETTDKFITIDSNYLSIKSLPTNITNTKSDTENTENTENTEDTEDTENTDNIDNIDNFTFYIIDSIVNSNIITNKSNLPAITMQNTTPYTTMSNNKIPNNTMSNKKIPNNTEINEAFTVKLDSTKDIPIYNNIFTKPTNFSLNDYLQDNYVKTYSSDYTSISNKYNDIITKSQLSTSLNKNEDEYKSIYKLNLEVEREIANLNMGLNAKNDRLINGLDKMRITDMANDYFFLKNLNKNQ